MTPPFPWAAALLRSRWSWWWKLVAGVAGPAVLLTVLSLRALRIEQADLDRWTDAQIADLQRQFGRDLDEALGGPARAAIEAGTRHQSENSAHLQLREPGLAGPVFIFSPGGPLAFGSQRVYFGSGSESRPVSLHPPPLVTSLIQQAGAAEAQRRLDEARTLYERIAVELPALGEWAGFSSLRIAHARGDPRAISQLADPAWGRSTALSPSGLPVALVAALNVESWPPDTQPHFAGMLRASLTSLRAGTWWLSYDERRFYDGEIQRLLKNAGDGPAFGPDEALAEIGEAATGILQTHPPRGVAAAWTWYQMPVQDVTAGASTSNPIRARPRPAFLIRWVAHEELEGWRGVALRSTRAVPLIEPIVASVARHRPFSIAIRDEDAGHLAGALADNEELWRKEPLRAVGGWVLAIGVPTHQRSLRVRQSVWYVFALLLFVSLAGAVAVTIRQGRRELEFAKTQNDFIDAVDRELRHPIATLRALLERGRGSRIGPAVTSPAEASLTRDADRLERSVEQLLEWLRMQAGRRGWLRTPVALDGLARAAIERCRPEADASGIRLEFRSEGDAPLLSLDETAIGQAVEDLIDNAVCYSPAGAQVTVLLQRAGDEVHLDVWDEGAGIEADDLPKIFDPFFRGTRGPAAQEPGAGLGLTLVKHIVEAHGGAVLVTSAPGHGSRFSIRFPLSETAV